MSGNLSGKQEPTTAEEAFTDETDDGVQRPRICPRKLLGSLSHLRMDGTRIKLIESQAPKVGGQGAVEAAILARPPPSSTPESNDAEWVAVKKLRVDEESDGDRALAPLAHEVNLLNELSHWNVVKIIGFVEDVEKGVAWMVFVWEKNGNLREFIRSAKWELPERVSLIHDVARGLSYLHRRSPPICHGDLKSLNILVNSVNQAVITDFGSARAVDPAAEGASKGVDAAVKTTSTSHQTVTEAPTAEIAPLGEFITLTGPAWTVRWAAPELLKGGLPGLGSDIWALGWICWEAVTGNFPFEKETDIGVIIRITKGDLPTIENTDQFKQMKALCSLMRECWRLDTAERPTALRCQQLVSFMNGMVPSRRDGSSLSATHSSGLLDALGRIQLRDGMFTEARGYFEQSLKVAESVGNEWDRARALNALGDASYLRSEYSAAEESYTQAREIYSRTGSQLGLAQSVKGLGDVYRMRNEYSKAEESYIQARVIYSQIGNRLGFAQSVDSLGDVYFMRDEYAKAEESYIQTRDIYSQMGNQLGFAQAVKGLGDVYRMRGEYSKAEESYIQTRDVFSQIGDQLGFAQSIKGLGDVYGMRNEYSKAEESYIQARDIYSQLGGQLGFAQSVKRLGDVYCIWNEYSKAEESYIQARDTFSQIGEQVGFAQTVKSLGDVYDMLNESSKAEESYIHARDIFSEIGDKLGLAQTVKSLGDVYGMRNEYSKAKELYIQARNIYSQIGDQAGLAHLSEGMGHVHLTRGEYAMAEESYSEAERIYQRIGDRCSLANISWYMGWLHRNQSRYGAAERLVREASTTYSELGLEQRVELCNQFLEEVRSLMEEL